MKGKPDAALAARIRELKDHCGISYRKLGDAIGVPKTSAADYASGKTHIPADLLRPMADAFGCNPRYLLMPPGAPIRSMQAHGGRVQIAMPTPSAERRPVAL